MNERKEYIRTEGNCEIKETIDVDGSKTVRFLDKETGAAHITIYDANGKMIESVHGYIR